MTPKAWSIKINDKLHSTKIKTFCSVKYASMRIIGRTTDQKKIFAIPTSNKGLASSIYKFSQMNNKKIRTPFKNDQETWTMTSTNRIYGWK